MSVNKLCALFTVSLWSVASQIPFLYVVQWNILDNFLETIYIIYIKIKILNFIVSSVFQCFLTCTVCHVSLGIGHKSSSSAKLFQKQGRKGMATLRRKLSRGFNLTLKDLSRALPAEPDPKLLL